MMRLCALVLALAAAPAAGFVPAVAPTLGAARVHQTRVAPMMGGKENVLRDRITSVTNTRKITEAMRLVAAAKVRRAQEAVLQTRPFSETLQSVFSGLVERLGKEPLELPLLQARSPRRFRTPSSGCWGKQRAECGVESNGSAARGTRADVYRPRPCRHGAREVGAFID